MRIILFSKKQLNKLKSEKLKLKRRKIEIVNEANSYTEEVRRTVNENYGFEKIVFPRFKYKNSN